MSKQQAAAILPAADRWKQQCLLDGGSLFGDQRLWTGRNFEQLRVHFVESPDEGSDSFYEKLRRQLGPAPPEAKRLWSEMTWVFYLVVRNVTPETKRDQIARVWEWSGARLPEGHWALGDDVLTGCANTGAGYLTHRWRELRFIVLAMLDWFSLPRQEHDALSADPWRFAGWLADRRLVQGRQFRHALLFLLFPDSFEPILVGSQKRAIVQGFARSWGEAPPAEGDDVAIDRRLLATRTRIQAEHAGETIDFYRSPFVEKWRTGTAQPQKRATPDDVPPSSNGEDDKAWFRERFGDVDVWAIAPGAGAHRWTDFQQRGIAAIDYDGVGDLSEYQSLDDIRQAAIESGLGDNPINHSLAMWDFAHEMGAALLRRRSRERADGFCNQHGKSYLTRRRGGEEGGGGGSVTGGTIPSA